MEVGAHMAGVARGAKPQVVSQSVLNRPIPFSLQLTTDDEPLPNYVNCRCSNAASGSIT